jgi:hypothetical protein
LDTTLYKQTQKTYKTPAFLQSAGSKNEPDIVFMRKS